MHDGAIGMSGSATIMNAQTDGFAALGVATLRLLGLLARKRGMGGQKMDSSMLLTAAHGMTDHVVDFPGNPEPPNPGSEQRGVNALYRHLRRRQRLDLPGRAAEGVAHLAKALAGHADLLSDPRFFTSAGPEANDGALAESLTDIFARRPEGRLGAGNCTRRESVAYGRDGANREDPAQRLVRPGQRVPLHRGAPGIRASPETRTRRPLLTVAHPGSPGGPGRLRHGLRPTGARVHHRRDQRPPLTRRRGLIALCDGCPREVTGV